MAMNALLMVRKGNGAVICLAKAYGASGDVPEGHMWVSRGWYVRELAAIALCHFPRWWLVVCPNADSARKCIQYDEANAIGVYEDMGFSSAYGIILDHGSA